MLSLHTSSAACQLAGNSRKGAYTLLRHPDFVICYPGYTIRLHEISLDCTIENRVLKQPSPLGHSQKQWTQDITLSVKDAY